jgi:hypothetical protein
MNIPIEWISVAIGSATSIVAILKQLGLFDRKNKQIDNISKLVATYGDLRDESKDNMRVILKYETRKLRDKYTRKLDIGSLVAYVILAIIIGILTYLSIIWFSSNIAGSGLTGWFLKIISGVSVFIMFIMDIALISVANENIYKNKEEE